MVFPRNATVREIKKKYRAKRRRTSFPHSVTWAGGIPQKFMVLGRNLEWETNVSQLLSVCSRWGRQLCTLVRARSQWLGLDMRDREEKTNRKNPGEEELGYKLIVIHGVIPRGKRTHIHSRFSFGCLIRNFWTIIIGRKTKHLSEVHR